MRNSAQQHRSKLDLIAQYISIVLTQYWPVLLVVGLFFFSYCTYITLQTADLGRHIVNGRQLLAGNSELLYSNYYSLTQSSQPFINHHWLFGLMVFWIQKMSGFSGLTLFNALINTFGFLSTILLAKLVLQKELKINSHKASATILAISAFSSLPFFLHRLEVRPESISLFLFGLFYLVTESINQKIKLENSFKKNLRHNWLPLAILLILQIIWTNSHLFFIFGPLLVGYQLFSSVVSFTYKRSAKKIQSIYFWVITTSIFFLTTLLSPHGINGLLAPFKIFESYAYRVAENQSSWFMISYGATGITIYSYSIALLSILTSIFIWKIAKRKLKFSKYLFLAILFAVLANFINRMTSFFGITLIPILTILFTQLYLQLRRKNIFNPENSVNLLFSSTLGILLILFILFSGLFLPKRPFGFGLLPKTSQAAEFIQKTNISGPFFNNYDSGGYFTYYLYPTEKPFIDNRPEAYSTEFLQNEYLAAINNSEAWSRVSEKYRFNAIFFYRHDQVDGAQEFLYQRVIDPHWVPVYIDGAFLIFVKNTPENAEIISEFEIPQDIFSFNNI